MLSPHEQNALVTGATDGVGRALATRMAQLGATVLVHGRDGDRLEETVAEIRRRTGSTDLHALRADLACLADVEQLADEVGRRVDRLHLLVSNAGIGVGPPDAEREVSDDGIELRFAVNHLAAFHLTRRLVPLLEAGAPARVVQVVSRSQEALDADDLLTEHGWTGGLAYGRSKLAQTMTALDMAEELDGRGVSVHALHPATAMDTTMVHDAGMEPRNTLEAGVTAAVRLSLDPTLDEATGGFFDGSREDADALHVQTDDRELRALLRRRSDEMVACALDRHRRPHAA